MSSLVYTVEGDEYDGYVLECVRLLVPENIAETVDDLIFGWEVTNGAVHDLVVTLVELYRKEPEASPRSITLFNALDVLGRVLPIEATIDIAGRVLGVGADTVRETLREGGAPLADIGFSRITV